MHISVRYTNKVLAFRAEGLNGRTTRQSLYGHNISAGHLPDGGGPSYKATSTEQIDSTDSSASSSGPSGTSIVTTSTDSAADGDGDPDSDIAQPNSKIFELISRLQIAHTTLRRNAAERIVRMPELKTRVGLSRSTIYEAIKNKAFPPSVPLGPRAVGWFESDIDRWLNSRVGARNVA